MNSSTPGRNTSAVEVTNISAHGFWLLAGNEELFLPYEEFPWFKEATVGAILHVEEPAPDHYHWPNLDVDLTREIIRHPKRFPLRAGIAQPGQRRNPKRDL
uniref:DUF2442 domain-containing protein n=1 Tax=Candidatus Kentrum sp. FM TaxID=2126340 RepID=A0A450SB60_9GAMM|nr:MAG: Protein of unknown function (DUF2442) [Candidatus Kentron sp. FM]VFJ49458.1 MAG: Protein of unknown function (DUF2442) [Candidatus Kentron sp. FM]VFK13539.1 MAG: Protein of unknown function (DUF2442) [Candidatus Kentron sp. FM]